MDQNSFSRPTFQTHHPKSSPESSSNSDKLHDNMSSGSISTDLRKHYHLFKADKPTLSIDTEPSNTMELYPNHHQHYNSIPLQHASLMREDIVPPSNNTTYNSNFVSLPYSFHNDANNIDPTQKRSPNVHMDPEFNTLQDFPAPPSLAASLVYNDFDLANTSSFDSIPETSFENRVVDASDPNEAGKLFNQSVNNLSLSDLYTPVHSDASSFTPCSTFFEEPTKGSASKSLNQHQHPLQHTYQTHAQTQLQYHYSPTPQSSNNKITKKQSLRHMNSMTLKNKKSLKNLSSITPVGVAYSSFNVSPSSSNYRGDDQDEEISPMIMKEAPFGYSHRRQDAFTENLNYEETYRRKTYPTPEMKSTSVNNLPYEESFESPTIQVARKKPLLFTEGRITPALTSHESSNIDLSKPKKHTRRRLLPRSKNGCWICRIKHLKCDEARPVCSSCTKFNIDCDYSSVKPEYVTNKELRNIKLVEISNQIRQNQTTTRGEKVKKTRLGPSKD
ncbi:uncharacterized protein PRCAT00000688001 [Priceomyces carsonii]|uniref:uncharacterized protein n=1 Tax=Priceomyces carsonii TaxID=28549 RepID=UPI002ED841A4|nr:unnamed protein product [Priceomyces carsonii]